MKHKWQIDDCGCAACALVRGIAADDTQARKDVERLHIPTRIQDCVTDEPDEFSHQFAYGGVDRNAERIQAKLQAGTLTVSDVLALKPRWNPMLLKHPPLTAPVSGRKGRKTKCSDEGTIFRAPHRLLIDGAVFGRKVRERTASVLIDASGSMALSEDNITDILKQYPAGIIAMYSGELGRSELVILARNGRRVSTLPSYFSGNTCDGLALEWLSKQTAPRYWVSDGYVTETHDRLTIRAMLACQGLCQRHAIKRFPVLDDLLAKTR